MTKSKSQKQRGHATSSDQLTVAMASSNLNYGRDETEVEKWQMLCEDCGVDRGRSIRACKKVMSFDATRDVAIE